MGSKQFRTFLIGVIALYTARVCLAGSGFYLTVPLEPDGLSPNAPFQINISRTEGQSDGFYRISLSKNNYGGLEEAVLEIRDDNQHMLLKVPVAFSIEDGKRIADLYVGDIRSPDIKLLIYFKKRVVAGELANYYDRVPENCFGVGYKIDLASSKETPDREKHKNPSVSKHMGLVVGAFVDAWRQVQAMDNSLLAGINSVQPKIEKDSDLIVNVELMRNASFHLKTRSLGPNDEDQPYLWISAQIYKPGPHTQPTSRDQLLVVHGQKYVLSLRVGSNDHALAQQVISTFNRSLARWFPDQMDKNKPSNSTASSNADK